MRISVVTPSFRSSRWLKLCIASVADQEAEHEHIIQDSCSDDGTLEWLPCEARVKAFIEKDNGMYDAINRGLRRTNGDILAYLNCDEQYLPATLECVADFFQRHSEVEVVFASAVVVDAQGNYLCHREPVLPGKSHTWVCGNLATLTCATFFRRSIISERQLLFEAGLRAVGDAEWILRLLEAGVKMSILPRFTSVFTETGTNLILRPEARDELRRFIASAPKWLQYARPLLISHHRLRRLVAGHYWTKPFHFSLYTQSSPDRRVTRNVERPTFRWIRPDPLPASHGQEPKLGDAPS
ncbi:MAG: glycosyltransferase [Verrucomicrobia subdivision 3 bacterium]|nr:glycosyltransferase [Limisphaerales bacterium]